MFIHDATKMSKEARVLNFCNCGQRLVIFLDKVEGETVLSFGCDACNCGTSVNIGKQTEKQLRHWIEAS